MAVIVRIGPTSVTGDLLASGESEAINALVVMTDGQENESFRSLDEIQQLIDSYPDQRLVIFTVAFGSDADEALLAAIAEIGAGQLRRAGETEIEELYRSISTYV